MMSRLNDRSVFADLNARNESEVIDNIYDRTIITTNSANILNIMSESPTVNPEEEVIRKRGRKKTPKISELPLRRSPRKTPRNTSNTDLWSAIDSQSTSQSDQTHDYFLRTPKKSPTKTPIVRTPAKTPSKTGSTPLTPRRVSPRKRLQLDSNDSGLGISPALSGRELTPSDSCSSGKTISKSKSNKSLVMTRRRRRRYF